MRGRPKLSCRLYPVIRDSNTGLVEFCGEQPATPDRCDRRETTSRDM